MHVSPRLLAAGLSLLLLSPAGHALDWPTFRGALRDDVSRETGLLKEWPPGGPKRVWLYDKAGLGYSGPAIVAGKFYTLGTRDEREVLIALDANSGKELWAVPLSEGILQNKWGNGPRGTPTVDGDKIYALSGEGTLGCFQAADGKSVWSKELKALGGKRPGWGYTESVLVDGNQVVCTPGGPNGTIAAFDKTNGNLLWQSAEWQDNAQYASIVKAKINGEEQYVQLTMENFAGVEPKSGKVLWKAPWPGKVAVIPTPIVKDNYVFINSGYLVGCKLVKINPGNQVEEVYRNQLLKNHHGGVILYGDHLYGHSDRLGWLCMEFLTGNETWVERNKLGKGAIGCADGMLYCLDEDKGTVVLIEASPKGWAEHGSLTVEPQSTIRSRDGRIWTHPTIADGKLYLRDQEYIYCYDVKGK